MAANFHIHPPGPRKQRIFRLHTKLEESFHNQLKTVYFEGKRNRRIDVLLETLLQIENNFINLNDPEGLPSWYMIPPSLYGRRITVVRSDGEKQSLNSQVDNTIQIRKENYIIS
ncbi:uncharacterized protein LOC134240103 [Saccostrea cucullata]|uniref:uncharacterized protein LOC134240103 n=1 Tax=Saccostrea cuccullata TaxID=36930 RepID=UPI002ED59D55